MGLTKIRATQISNLDYKQSCRVLSNADVTLSGGAPSVVDDVSVMAGDRVLVTGQDDRAQNGIYRVQTVGAGANGTWVRTTDADQTGEVLAGMIVMVTEGTVYKDTQWKLITNDPITIGVTELDFELNSAFAFGNIFANGVAVIANTVGDAVTFTAGTNMVITGNAQTQTILFASTGGGGNGSVAGANTEVQFNDDGAFGASGNFTFDKSYANSSGLLSVNSILTQEINTDDFSITGTVTGNVIPVANVVYDFGNNTARWNNIWIGDTSVINVGNGTIAANTTSFVITNPDGSPFTSGGGGGLTWTTQANTAPTSPNPGDFWYDSFTQVKFQYINDGTGNVWVDQSAPTTFASISTGQILNTNSPGVGNIGSSGAPFNTIFAQATSAQYADLAEIYATDQYYDPGTVVIFGGDQEITASDRSHDTRVAGVISTNPAFIMNGAAVGLQVALCGRVPCRVLGPVIKGDVLVTSELPGTAQRLQTFKAGCILGKSLGEISDNSVQIIEVVVGRF